MIFNSIISKFILRKTVNSLYQRNNNYHVIASLLSKRLNNTSKWSTTSGMMITITNNRGIKTTNKKDDSHVEVYDPEYLKETKPKGPETAKEFADVSSQKNWISFGYDQVDQKEDRHLANLFFLSYFTLGCLVFSWIIYYYPYLDGADWALREAFLEVDRCERLGLPYINPNLVDPELITLPSEEELKKLDFEIHL